MGTPPRSGMCAMLRCRVPPTRSRPARPARDEGRVTGWGRAAADDHHDRLPHGWSSPPCGLTAARVDGNERLRNGGRTVESRASTTPTWSHGRSQGATGGRPNKREDHRSGPPSSGHTLDKPEVAAATATTAPQACSLASPIRLRRGLLAATTLQPNASSRNDTERHESAPRMSLCPSQKYASTQNDTNQHERPATWSRTRS